MKKLKGKKKRPGPHAPAPDTPTVTRQPQSDRRKGERRT